MPYADTDDGHRVALTEDIMNHAKQVFESGLQLEAILLVHEYLEQELNQLYNQAGPASPHTVHRKFKNVIDMLASERMLGDEDYGVLNEFNRLRNVNSNLILNSSLTLKGAKKGDMVRAMNLAYESEQIISRLFQEIEVKKSRRKKRKSS
jgi:hypothetical protein